MRWTCNNESTDILCIQWTRTFLLHIEWLPPSSGVCKLRIALQGTLDWGFAPSVDAEGPAYKLNPEDLVDIRAILNGDSERYARIIARYQNTVGDYMWRFSRIPAKRDQLVHDVFVDAYLGLAKFRGEAPLIHWLRKIATRVGYRYWSQQAKEIARGETSIEPYHGELAQVTLRHSSDERTELLHQAMECLKPRDRLTLVLIYFEQLSIREAAEALGWSETLVRVQAHRARRRLEKLMNMLAKESGHET